MEEIIQDYFLCDNCENRDFKLIYNFSICFHKVNFSDKLIYYEVTEERYQCTKCEKIYTKEQIQEKLTELKRKRKGT